MTPTPDPPPAAPLTAQALAVIQSRFDDYSGRWYRQEATTLATDIALNDVPCLLRSHTALRARLARAEAREDGMRQALDDARRVLLHTYDSITEYGRYDSDTAADVIHAVHDITDALGEGLRFATPTDGTARAGDAP